MDCGLRMNEDIDFVEAHAEEPAGFDHFEAFVHQGGRIDRDSAAHFPIGMSESLLGGYAAQLRNRSFSKWAARSGKHKSLYFAILACSQTLVDRIVLAVNWKESHVIPLHCGHHHFPGCDKDLFIGEGDLLAVFDCFVCCRQAHYPYRGRHNKFGIGMSGDTLDSLGAE